VFWLVNLYSFLVYIKLNGDESPKDAFNVILPYLNLQTGLISWGYQTTHFSALSCMLNDLPTSLSTLRIFDEEYKLQASHHTVQPRTLSLLVSKVFSLTHYSHRFVTYAFHLGKRPSFTPIWNNKTAGNKIVLYGISSDCVCRDEFVIWRVHEYTQNYQSQACFNIGIWAAC
jgi:hypothetical protein